MGRASRDDWAKRVERWKDSGLSAKVFAAEVGVNASTLSYWKWRLAADSKKRIARKRTRKNTAVVTRKSPAKKTASLAVRPLSFVEITKASSAAVAEPFEIELVSGERVRVPSSFDAEALARLLAVLERR
jgi:hypothetical protein